MFILCSFLGELSRDSNWLIHLADEMMGPGSEGSDLKGTSIFQRKRGVLYHFRLEFSRTITYCSLVDILNYSYVTHLSEYKINKEVGLNPCVCRQKHVWPQKFKHVNDAEC